MKSERRHELHQNDLAQWLGKVADWAKKHINQLTAVVLGVAVIFVAWVWISRHLSSRQDEVYENYRDALMQSDSTSDQISRLEKVADQDRNKFLAAAANLNLGDLYAVQVTIGSGKVDSDQNKESLAKATAYYKTVIDKYSDQKPMVAMAYVGLGTLAEDAAKWDEAKAMYEKAQSTAPEGYPVLYRAKQALARLDQVKVPVILATTMPSTQPESAPSAQPQSPFVLPSPVQSKTPATTTVPALAPTKAATRGK